MWCNNNFLKKGAVALVVVSLVWILVETYRPLTSNAGSKIEFAINQGDRSAKTARLLAEQGIVRSRYLFIGYTLLVGKEKKFKAGKYLLSKSMSIPEIVRIFSEGKAQPDGVLVTVPEGSNAWEIVKILESKFKGLKVSGLLAHEGYLFPDTYWFRGDENEDEIVKKMKDNFDEKTKNYKLNEAMIIASILEKEVKTEEDMKLVAGIIYKRLELGMLLQIDATVAYGTCLFQWRNDKSCDVTQANLVDNIPRDSEYNTYMRKGLPAGPISNPGLKALNAALNPAVSSYLYYLSSKDDNRTIFSKTAEEHQRNRARYFQQGSSL